MRKNNYRLLMFSADVFRDGGDGEAHVWKREFVGDDGAPSGSSKMNW